MKQILYLFGIAIILVSSCKKDNDNPIIVTNAESLTLRLNQILEESDFPGFTIGIVKNGKAVYQNSFGYQNIENKIEYTNQTIQPIGSVSKTFIAAAVVKSIELGYFNLETPINNILAKPIVNPKNTSAEIRVKHLVNHTSGLVDVDETYTKSYYILNDQNISTPGAQLLQNFGIVQRTPKTLKEFIEAYYYEGGDYYSIDNFTDSEPGEVEIYSNVAASLMAYLIEKTSGISYQNFMQTHVFNLLEMSHTSFEYKIPYSQYATLYYEKNTPFPMYDFESFPDGALKTSNEDLMKYLLNMIAGQRGESNILFDESHYNLLFTKTSDDHSIFWYLGNEEDSFGHNGSDPGVSTEVYFNGSQNSGFFMLSNYDTSTNIHEMHYEQIITQIFKSVNEFLIN